MPRYMFETMHGPHHKSFPTQEGEEEAEKTWPHNNQTSIAEAEVELFKNRWLNFTVAHVLDNTPIASNLRTH